jgi:hypothetical protein
MRVFMNGGVRMPMVVAMPIIVSMSMSMFMPVVPEFSLVEQKEKQQAHQQSQEQLVRTGLALEGLRQKVQERGRHQSTRSQAQHVLGVAAQNAKTQPSRHPDAANARHQSTHQNRQ